MCFRAAPLTLWQAENFKGANDWILNDMGEMPWCSLKEIKNGYSILFQQFTVFLFHHGLLKNTATTPPQLLYPQPLQTSTPNPNRLTSCSLYHAYYVKTLNDTYESPMLICTSNIANSPGPLRENWFAFQHSILTISNWNIRCFTWMPISIQVFPIYQFAR